MTVDSHLHAARRRLLLQKRSSQASARALRQGALLLPLGPVRSKVQRWAKRIGTCAETTKARFIMLPGQPTVLRHLTPCMCFCRVCQTCEAKKANSAACDLIELMPFVWELAGRGAKPLMLTLTSKNAVIGATGADIYEPSQRMLLRHQKALKRLFQHRRICDAILGHVTSIECDFAIIDGQLTVHWHSHSLVIAAPGALSDHRYIRQAEYVRIWHSALGKPPYRPVLDIRKVKGLTGSTGDPGIRRVCREVLKYCLDTDGYVHHADGLLTVDPRAAVAFTVGAYRRRLISTGGVFDTAKQLRATMRNAASKNSGHLSDT